MIPLSEALNPLLAIQVITGTLVTAVRTTESEVWEAPRLCPKWPQTTDWSEWHIPMSPADSELKDMAYIFFTYFPTAKHKTWQESGC